MGSVRYDLDDLRLFLHTVTEGSITAGAARLRLSLPSASARIRALEHHAGVTLLVRGRRGVRPTPAGATLARHAREVLDRAALLESAVGSYVRPDTAPLRLLAGGSAMHHLVPRALASFLSVHPHIDVAVSESRTPLTVRRLAAGEADLGVILNDGAHDDELRTESLGDDSLVVIGQRGGTLSGRTAVSYEEVAEHPLVGLNAESSLRLWIEARLGEHAPAVRYRTTVAGPGVVVELAAAGVGLAIVPRRTFDPDQPLDVCELLEPWASREHLLAWGAGPVADSAEITALADLIRRATRSRRPHSPESPPGSPEVG